MNLYYLHYCPSWDGMLIDSLSRQAEMACCGCEWVPEELKDRLGERYRYGCKHYNKKSKALTRKVHSKEKNKWIKSVIDEIYIIAPLIMIRAIAIRAETKNPAVLS